MVCLPFLDLRSPFEKNFYAVKKIHCVKFLQTFVSFVCQCDPMLRSVWSSTSDTILFLVLVHRNTMAQLELLRVFGNLCFVHKTLLLILSPPSNDNDNDNDTLREVPHQSNEGLALQARVSGPWPLEKESVLLGKLAPWQGVQIQTVVDRVQCI